MTFIKDIQIKTLTGDGIWDIIGFRSENIRALNPQVS